MADAASATHSFRSGYVAIIGVPNVGKSTLLNAFVRQKISIVTPKPQTTRHKILGICSRDDVQVLFLDTPGIVKPKYLLHESMMKAARSAIDEADLILFMVDVSTPKANDPAAFADVLGVLKQSHRDVFLVINKTDLARKIDVATLIVQLDALFPFKEIFPISAMTLEGTEQLLAAIVNAMPEHAPYYPTDIISERPERFFVAEIIREKIFEYFRDEIPYSTAVDIIDFKEQSGKKDHIQAEIVVERDSQRIIVIGKGGRALKEVGELARKDIERFLNRRVFLELHVKVRDQWRKSAQWLRRFGYGG